MGNFYASFSVVFPMFILILLGYAIKSLKMLDSECLNKLNKVCFTFFMSAMMFRNTCSIEFSKMNFGRVFKFAIISLLILIAVSVIFVCLTEKDNRKRGVLIQCLYRSDYLIFGLHITESLYGVEATAIPSLLGGIVIPIYNIAAVIILESFNGSTISASRIIKSILKNPLLIGCVGGMIFSIFGLHLPQLLQQTVNDLASITTPLMLIILGASFEIEYLERYKKYLWFYSFMRLVGIGLVILPIAVLLGFKGVELTSLMAIYTSPIAIGSYAMSYEMGGDAELNASFIVTTSMGSLITIFLWTLAFRQMGLL